MILIALAAAATPLLLPEIARDLRCVAVLGVSGDASIAGQGAYFAAVVGADAMDATGLSREAGSGDQGIMSIFSPWSSPTTA